MGRGVLALMSFVFSLPLVHADLPADALKRLDGRWFKEARYTEMPDVQTMWLHRVAPNRLAGRFNDIGPYEDVGMAATLSLDGDVFTLTLVDDELREHSHIPTIVLTGHYDGTARELSLKEKAADGKYMTWRFDARYAFRATFSSTWVYETVWNRWD